MMMIDQISRCLPFSFIYGRKQSGVLLAMWDRKTVPERVDEHRTRRTTTWTDPESALEVRMVTVEYVDFPVVEWTVYFKNNNTSKTPILEDIQALDTEYESELDGNYLLHYWKGDGSSDLFEPHEIHLDPGGACSFAPFGGRPSDSAFPYYNLQVPGGGAIIAIGWPGQWAATFACDSRNRLRLKAGQELTHLSLNPSEEIRTPLVAMLFWNGVDTVKAQNIWRRWMWKYNVPRIVTEEKLKPILAGTYIPGDYWSITDENQTRTIEKYYKSGIDIDAWWCDLGWFEMKMPDNPNHYAYDGLYRPAPERFPEGLSVIKDRFRDKGMKIIAWFEPEHYYPAPGNWLLEHFPMAGHMLEVPPGHEDEINQGLPLGNRMILDYGHPGSLQWILDNISRVILEEKIDIYRHDFNIEPLMFWRANDLPDRQGITENHYIKGFLAFYDGLLERFPGLIIDNCASGGRRNDLETMRRSVPFHPTDFDYSKLEIKQAFHQSLFQWIPYFGSNTVPVKTVDPYAFRSGHGMCEVLLYDMAGGKSDVELLCGLVEEWRRIVPYYYGDFYPMTPYNIAQDQWLAWQFHRPEHGDGLIEAFRRGCCEGPEKVLVLRGLVSDAQYEFTCKDMLDGKDIVEPIVRTGIELMQDGLTVRIAGKPGAIVITYKML